MTTFLNSYINDTVLCGENGFHVWDEKARNFGHCFQDLALILPAQACLGVVSAYYLGFQASQWFLRTPCQKYLLVTRSVVTLVTALLPIVQTTTLYCLDQKTVTRRGEAALLSGAIQCFSWFLHLMYTYLLYHRLSLSIRGPKPIILAWVLCLLVNILQIHSSISEHWPLKSVTDKVYFGCAIVNTICQAIYFISLIPEGDQTSSQYQEFSIETDPLFQRLTHSSYGGFHEENDPHYLGVAKEESRVGRLSRLFFRWVDPLVVKAGRGGLHQPDDVFDLPEDLTPHTVAGQVRREWDNLLKLDPVTATDPGQVPRVKLVTLLYTCFGREFFLIGILKFLADCAGFAGPILLNCVVSFMESRDTETSAVYGYIYAVLLAFSTFAGSLSSCHFNLFMTELGIKVRAALTTAVYDKTVTVSKSSLNKFSPGQIINFMSTDTDRVLNFGPSIHAAWSLPFQFLVTLILLYQQVGISFLAGLIITVLLVPINKCIANKIGSLSTKMMDAKDQRVSVMSEILSGIRVIKYFTWEDVFTEKVQKTRKEELKYLAGRKYLDALCVFLWATTPVLISVLTFVMYVMLGNTLTAAKVFTAVALFAMLTGPLNAFPWVLNGLIEAMVSIKRLEQFLSLPEFNPELYFTKKYEMPEEDPDTDNDVQMRDCVFTHKAEVEEGVFHLDLRNLSVVAGSLVVVVGEVGSGKSSLLEAVLGELERREGSVCVVRPAGGLGLVRQEPWLQQGSIRDNILFGKPYQHSWYSRVVEACALTSDLQQLARRDQSPVGEGGASLSGGQRARVALARAVYQDKDLYLIDDIFSAVDSEVATHIYRKCILGLLRNKTRVLCTHHTKYVQAADKIVMMEEGRIKEQGAPLAHADTIQTNYSLLSTPSLTGRSSPTHDSGLLASPPHTEPSEPEPRERRETGRVALSVYRQYWTAVGSLLSPLILLSLLAMQVSRNLTDVWLAHWVSAEQSNGTQPNKSFVNHNDWTANDNLHSEVKYYLYVYGTIAVSNTLFSLLRAFLFAYGGISAARTIHSKLIKTVMRAKILFFDLTPLGQILNRFSSDLSTVDDSLPFILNIFLANLFGVVGPLIVTVYAVPWICLILLPLTFVYFKIQAKYRPASRDLKRIGSVAMSPIYTHYSETLSGVTTIRAMQAVPRFMRENMERLESSLKTNYSGQAASQWLELRLQMIGCAVVTGVAVIAVVEHHIAGANPGLVGLAISYALGITGKLSGLVSSFTETERELVAVERCGQYLKQVKQEQTKGTITSPYNWPSEGVISMRSVAMRYQEHLPRALRGVSLQTKSGEKIGVVGRTGSGKSSVFHCLYRLTEIESGEIHIDNVNIRMLDIDELRAQMVIIPQQPFLFNGTVKENLDPVGFYSTRRLQDIIKRCRLERLVARVGGLHGSIREQGGTFSAGEKQLLCLARAVLSPCKIVLIDEATANVDAETDRVMQEVVQQCLGDRTIITIAHRVDTVLACDRVLVMDQGTVVESGHPNALLQDSASKFSRFVNSR